MREDSFPTQHPQVHPEPDFDSVHRFSAWLERLGKAAATVEAYHADVAHLARAYAPRPLAELGAQDLSEYLDARASLDGDGDGDGEGEAEAGRVWSRATVRRHLHAIKAFYRYLLSEEESRGGERGPAEALAEPVPEPKAPHVISETDVARLFGFLESRARSRECGAERMDLALYGLCYHAALLVSEAIGLTREAVVGGPSAMHLDVVGRRGEESRVTVEGQAARWLATWLAERPVAKRVEHRPFVFIHPRTLVHTSRQRAWDRLKRVAKAAGLEPEVAARITPHTLRHSYAAHLAARDLGVAELRAALRQHSPRHAVKYLAAVGR